MRGASIEMVDGPLGQRAMREEEIVLELSEGALEVSRVEKLELSGELIFDLRRDGGLSEDALERGEREVVVLVDGAAGAGF